MRQKMVLSIFSIFLVFFTSYVVSEASARSTSLTTVVTKDENIERTDYVDENGTITYALDKHYATVIKTSGEGTLMEQYFDEEGKPAQQPACHYALLREYNEIGQNYKVTYLDMDGQPVLNRYGYSAIHRTFDDDGRIAEERYYDPQDQPVRNNTFVYGQRKEYDEAGRNNFLTFIDQDGNPSFCNKGYASLLRIFYEEGSHAGKVKDEFYFDSSGNPVCLSYGQYGVHKEYDELGRAYVLTYLDKDGFPIVLTKGYATLKRTFYEDDSVRTEMYLDAEGKPVALSEGQYGLLYVNGKTEYLDANGKKLHNLRTCLQNHILIVVLIAMAITFISAFSGKGINLAMLILYLGCIGYMTLMFREGTGAHINPIPFWSNTLFLTNMERREELLKNLLLFVPLGAILFRFNLGKKMFLAPVFLSVFIEVAQFLTERGFSELDDIIFNSLGAMVGFAMAFLLRGIIMKFKSSDNIDNLS